MRREEVCRQSLTHGVIGAALHLGRRRHLGGTFWRRAALLILKSARNRRVYIE